MNTLNHWRYFLFLEGEVNATLRYVEFDESQKHVYSFEFARLLILICSELDVLFKMVCASVSAAEDADSIGRYCTCVRSRYAIEKERVSIDRFGIELTPFEHWTATSPPDWWTAHNKVKHHRHSCFAQATFIHVLNALSGLLVANLLALNEHGSLEGTQDRLVLLGRQHSPSYELREESYRVEMRGA